MVVDKGIFVEHLRAREKGKTTLFEIFDKFSARTMALSNPNIFYR